jgi:hypothetical protein
MASPVLSSEQGKIQGKVSAEMPKWLNFAQNSQIWKKAEERNRERTGKLWKTAYTRINTGPNCTSQKDSRK